MSGNTAPVNHLAFLNPRATNADGNHGRLLAVHKALTEPDSTYLAVYEPAQPAVIQDNANRLRLVSSDGGEGTTRGAIGALLGIEVDDPEQTAANYEAHQAIAAEARFFAVAGGNANNWPLSAHGHYAKRPGLLVDGWPHQLREHYPLYYQVTDEAGRIVHSNVAISGLGFGATGLAADRLNAAKPGLQNISALQRLAKEAVITGSAAVQVPAFSARLQFSSEHHRGALTLRGIAGLELIKSRIYAKRGKTAVNVDDTLWQPEVINAGNRLTRPLHIADAMLQLTTGRHPLNPVDFCKRQLSVQVSEPILFHADGETDSTHLLTPDQTLTARLTRLPVRTFVLSSR